MSVKKLLNKDALRTNILKFHDSTSGCCGKELTTCKYSVSIASTTGVTAVTFNVGGAPITVTFDSATTSEKDFRLKLATALRDHGYDAYFPDSYRGIAIDATTVVVIGEVEMVSLNDGSVRNFVKECEIAKVSYYQGTIDFDTDLGLMSLNQSGGTQIGTNAGFAAGDAAGLKAALIAALGTEAVAYKTVTVIQDDVLGKFIYTLNVIGNPALTIGGAILYIAGSEPDFIA